MLKSITTSGLLIGLAFNSFGQKSDAGQLRELSARLNQNQISFTENKGQVYDQNHQPRADVLFGGQSNGLVFHLRKNGISYQLNRIDKWKTEPVNSGAGKKETKPKGIEQSTVYRVDINWLDARRNPTILKGREFEGYSMFYTSSHPSGVKSFGEVTYQHLYKGIDLKWYEKNGELKYDYLCAAGSDYKKIKLQVEGAQSLRINPRGELEIITPLGTITEKAPLVLQNGKHLASKWLLTENVLSFNIENLNQQLDYVIDPAVRVWGTYYGGNSFDYANACVTYTNGDVYLVGSTYLNTSTIIATTAAHQSTLAGMDDAYLVKFNSSGVRQWSTYYGGNNSDNGRSVVVDASGDIYICGITSSTNGIASTGAHQQTAGGGNLPDGFLVKFNSSGVRQWGTYYGGNSTDEAHQCALDPSGNIYLSGSTDLATSTVIATMGVHQSAYGGGGKDAFLVKFNSSGVRQWGTYYGGTDIDFGNSCSADANNVYMAGTTTSTNAALFSGGHQSSFGGSLYDAYLVKFNTSNGTRDWGTFYGGNGMDQAFGCAVDGAGNVYMCGATSSSVTNVIATAASHQSVGVTVGDDDAFLVKFNSAGVRQWGTYYGGDSYETSFGCTIDASNNVYLAGTTSSTLSSAIAMAASHQTLLGNNFGGTNAFLTKFNSNGVRQWGTYYGEEGEDGTGCAVDVTGAIYLCGPVSTTNTSFISTMGAHQISLGGITDGFLVKFVDCVAPLPLNTTATGNQTLCSFQTTTLSAASGTTPISWYATATSTSVIGTGTTFVTSALSAGSYTFYAGVSSNCTTPPRLAITVTVYTTPTITASGGTICAGQQFTVLPSGANTYTVYDGNSSPLAGLVITSPITPSIYPYYVFGANANGCTSGLGGVAVINLTGNASPTLVVASGAICAGQSFVIQPAGAVSYTIQGGTATVSPLSTAQYTVIGSNSNGCVSASAATCTVTVDATPTVAVSNGSVCALSVYTIQPSGASTYTIQNGSNTVAPTSNSSYTIVGASPAGCLSQNVATCNISVLPTPTITAGSGTTCAGKSFTIEPSGAVTYSLLDNSGNAYTTNMVVAPLTTTNYIVGGTGANGCSATLFGLSVVNVTVNTVSITVNSGTICSGNSFTIVPGGAVTYTHQGGSNVVSPSANSIYTVAGTNNAGCIGTATSTVTIEAPPIFSVNSGSICAGSSFTIIPGGGSSYTISGGKTVVSPITTTNYVITGKSVGGCASSASVVCRVQVQLPPRKPFPDILTAPSDGEPSIVINPTYPLEGYTLDLYRRSDFLTINTESALSLSPVSLSEPVIFTLTVSPNINKRCNAIYTLQVNPAEDPTNYWVFPNFISPNGDGRNDTWSPTYKNVGPEIGSNFSRDQAYVLALTYKLGTDYIKEVKIVNAFNPEVVYYVNRPQESNDLVQWRQIEDLIKTPTFCTYIVTFKNGKTKTGLIGVDPTSKK